MLIKYSQNYNLFVFVFNSTEVETETLTIFCVMIPLLVDTWPDFGLFRVVRPYIQCRTSVEDVGPTLHKCFTNVLFLVGRDIITQLISCYYNNNELTDVDWFIPPID